VSRAARDTIVCHCHDATLADLKVMWREGYRHPDTVKRATAAFMGPCQGKYCAPLVQEILAGLAAESGVEIERRRPSVRAPLYPVRLGELAAPGGEGGR